MSDFAKAQLLKYGWSEGKGLGKNETGITQAIKPKLKFDTTGVGHTDKSWNEWWETAYNKASKNITVKTEDNNVSISVSKTSTSNEIVKEQILKKNPKYSVGYGSFLKTSTLLNGNLIKETNFNTPEVKKEENKFAHIPLTDEQLFEICGGRTAHKGARHGLTLNGKLKRIAEQEKALLGTSTSVDMLNKLDNYELYNNENTLSPPIEEARSVSKVSKSTKKKNRRRVNDLTHQLNISLNVNDSNEKNKQSSDDAASKKEFKKQRKKERKAESLLPAAEDVDKEEKDKRIDSTPCLMDQDVEKDIVEVEQIKYVEKKSFPKKEKKKSKKKRKQRYREDDIIEILTEDEDFQPKKVKMSHDRGANDLQINSLEQKFQLELSCTEPTVKSKEIRDSDLRQNKCNFDLLDATCKHDSHSKISKKKKWKHRKKEKIKLAKITKSLEAGNIDIEDFADEADSKALSKVECITLSSDTSCNDEADYLNSRISKKKSGKIRRKERMKLADITKSLEAVHFGTEGSNDRKTKKKVEAMVGNMVVNDIAMNKTELLKKQSKKKKKRIKS